jgi:2'-5' RNA ligase
LAELKLADYYHLSNNRPHITLGIFNELDCDVVRTVLEAIGYSQKAFQLSFQQIGVFPTSSGVVFWGPVVTQEFLGIHKKIYQRLVESGATAGAEYYAPGKWIPHCGLAMEVTDKENIPRIVESCQRLPHPHEATITEIGLIKFRPVEHLFSYPLAK